MIGALKNLINRFLKNLFGKKKEIKLGLYGPPNGGKTALANRICKDWLGEDMGEVSNIAHETREIQIKEQISIKSKGKELNFNLVDTPGIATKIDYEEFMKAGLKEKEAKQRAKDATKDPYTQVNITIVGNLQARNIPVLIVANKADLKKADVKKVQAAYPQYSVIGISAKYGSNVDKFYEALFEIA